MEEYFDFFADNESQSKSFNTTGVCNREKHYMVNINHKLKEIIRLIQKDKYFVINRPRQYGKTTTLVELEKILKTRYEVVKIDFQLIDSDFESEKRFCRAMIECMSKGLNLELERVETLFSLIKYISCFRYCSMLKFI